MTDPTNSDAPFEKSTLRPNSCKISRLRLPFIAKQAAIKGITAFLIPILASTSSAQQTAPLSKKEAAVKRKVDQFAPHAHISVIPIDSEEEYGQFVSSDRQSFTFYDIDRKTEVTLKYAEVRKVKNGYGGYNSVQNRHTDRTKALLICLAVAGALGGLIAAAATAKN